MTVYRTITELDKERSLTTEWTLRYYLLSCDSLIFRSEFVVVVFIVFFKSLTDVTLSKNKKGCLFIHYFIITFMICNRLIVEVWCGNNVYVFDRAKSAAPFMLVAHSSRQTSGLYRSRNAAPPRLSGELFLCLPWTIAATIWLLIKTKVPYWTFLARKWKWSQLAYDTASMLLSQTEVTFIYSHTCILCLNVHSTEFPYSFVIIISAKSWRSFLTNKFTADRNNNRKRRYNA